MVVTVMISPPCPHPLTPSPRRGEGERRPSLAWRRSSVQPLPDRLHDLGHLEGLPFDLVEALGGYEERRAQQGDELPVVHLRHEDPVEPPQQLAQVARERIQVAEVNV